MTESDSELAETIREVSKILAALLGLEATGVSSKVEFVEMGLDSLGAMDFIAGLEARFKIELPDTVHVEHPTVAALATHICRSKKK